MEPKPLSKAKWIFGILGLGLIGFGAFETFEVIKARVATQQLFVRYEEETQNGAQLPISLTPDRAEIVVKVQDPNFWRHHGVDLDSPLATTVTQSLVKKLYFTDFKPGFAKIEQSLIAYFAVAPLTSKNAQLAAFLDVNDFNGRALKWFGKTLAALNDDEFIAVIATNNNPNQTPGTAENIDRVARIKNYLAGRCARRNLADVWLDACAAPSTRL
jgi:membrane carboxypeptidase/penicillin-binding protein PbpC